MTVAIFPSLLHEDPRYYQMGKGPVKTRSFHAVKRLFVTYTDSGETRFNYSEIVGNAAAAGISNIYHAPEDRTAGRNIGTLGMLIMWDGLSNEWKEFWPDIRRKVFSQTKPLSGPGGGPDTCVKPPACRTIFSSPRAVGDTASSSFTRSIGSDSAECPQVRTC
jgi:hypothetical protein